MRAKAGDKGAAGALIEAYTPMLNAFARKADDPEDCFQDLALALLKGLQAFDPARGNVTGYFRQYLNVELLRRSDASHLDYRGVSVTAGLSLDMPWGTEDGVLAEVIPDDGAYAADQTVMDQAEAAQTACRYQAAMAWYAGLPPETRDIVRRHAIDGETYAAIGARFGKRKEAIKQIYLRAKWDFILSLKKA